MRWLKSGASVPKECVLDCSGVLLNAVCLAFNGCFYNDYLNTCMQILADVHVRIPKCLIKRDRSHLIKGMCKWPCFRGQAWAKKDLYVRCIAYALEIANLAVLCDVMHALFIVAQSQSCDTNSSCSASVDFLYGKIETFELEQRCRGQKCDYESLLGSEDIDSSDYRYIDENFENPSMSTAAFVQALDNESLLRCYNSEKGEPNPYYLPGICNSLLTLFYQFPAWTNVMNVHFKSTTLRSSSSIIETFYRIMKRDYDMNHSVSVHRFFLDIFEKIEGATKLGLRYLRLNPNWFADFESSITDENSLSQNIENNVLPRSNVETSSVIRQHVEIGNAREQCLVKKLWECSNNELTIAIFECSTIRNSVYEQFPKENLILNNLELKSLMPQVYVNGHIIDAFMWTIKAGGDWDGISFFTTDETNYILGHSGSADKNDDWAMYHITNRISGLIFLPFCDRQHWLLVVLDMDKGTFTFINPQNHDFGQETKQLFDEFISECLVFESEGHSLTGIDWRHVQPPTSRSLQTDSYNCAMFVMFYMDRMAERLSLYDEQFNPDNQRIHIASKIIAVSSSLDSTCLYCFETAPGSTIRECEKCNRWVHDECWENQIVFEHNCCA
ncbi:hypothetical protein QAD02_002215 [Eretmocerus hayati]|uniref:Uncharacterized protein n=1 Tax=Eretmocerus hayati TaxID=131215 RepID=A0ACC2NIM9_9HYME|nr:hypothetical protein QAD02_002215 [Eretmocerus hayati]